MPDSISWRIVLGVKSVANIDTVPITTTMKALSESARKDPCSASSGVVIVATLSAMPSPSTAALDADVAHPIQGRHDTLAARIVVARGTNRTQRISISRARLSSQSVGRCRSGGAWRP